jgi:hypothetical protein
MKNKHKGKQNMAHPPAEYEVTELKKMMRARDLKKTNLQGENEKLKGEIKECLAKMRKLQRQLMNGNVHRGRNTLRTREFDSYDHTNQDIIAQFCKNKLFPHQKFLHPSWKVYSVKDKSSLSYKCNKEIDVPVLEDGEFYWMNKTVPMINKKYCKIRANINSSIKVEYFGEYS